MGIANYGENIKKLAGLIRGIPVAMLTTAGGNDGALRSRPMMTQQVDFDGDLWFFTRDTTPKANEIQHEQQVNVCYMDHQAQRYVSVSGTAQIVRDQARMMSLWSSVYAAWFPLGLGDPELVLLKVDVHQAETWDAQSNQSGEMLNFVQ